MCGIFGGNPELLCDDPEGLLLHRGPDQQGRTMVSSGAQAPFMLGQTRLNVVYKGNVPTPMTRNGATVVFNGEIYNWRELRSDLETIGYDFETQTDTEVALYAYLEWGERCLDRFNGMFALAIWSGGELFIARDRIGKKPVFYTHAGGQFAFASELKCFRKLDFMEVQICENLEFYFDEYTPFQSIRSLKPGEFLKYSPESNRLTLQTWWHLPDGAADIHEEDEAVDGFLALFEDACRLRLAADVPVTVFLSGGTDSSLIQAVLGCDITYTVQFEEFRETIDESSLVKEFAADLGFDARIVVPSREDFLATLPEVARHIEYPVGSFSVYPLFCLARQMRQDGFVVAISGEGADELFNGYFRNELLLAEDDRIADDLRGPYGPLCSKYFGSGLARFCRMATRRGLGGVPALVDFLGHIWDDDASLSRNLRRVEASVFLQPLLTMADRMSMANSIEVRNPYLDYRLIEFSARLADNLRWRDGQGKWVVRRALRRLVGDDLGIVRRKIKHGLPTPANQWLFNKHTFDRREWNHILLGECLRQLGLSHSDVTTAGV